MVLMRTTCANKSLKIINKSTCLSLLIDLEIRKEHRFLAGATPKEKFSLSSLRRDPKFGGGAGGTWEVTKNQTQHSPSDDGWIYGLYIGGVPMKIKLVLADQNGLATLARSVNAVRVERPRSTGRVFTMSGAEASGVDGLIKETQSKKEKVRKPEKV
ncbi:hypothetical protein Lal_00043305 [Lupinus albus]|nr:hypothetical protein Lal_00043305 [Lupinus albus]